MKPRKFRVCSLDPTHTAFDRGNFTVYASDPIGALVVAELSPPAEARRLYARVWNVIDRKVWYFVSGEAPIMRPI